MKMAEKGELERMKKEKEDWRQKKRTHTKNNA